MTDKNKNKNNKNDNDIVIKKTHFPFKFTCYFPIFNLTSIKMNAIFSPEIYPFINSDYVFEDIKIHQMFITNTFIEEYHLVYFKLPLINKIAYYQILLNCYFKYYTNLKNNYNFDLTPELCVLHVLFIIEDILHLDRGSELTQINMQEGREIVLYTKFKAFNLLDFMGMTPLTICNQINMLQTNQCLIKNTHNLQTKTINTSEFLSFNHFLSYKKDRILINYGVHCLKRWTRTGLYKNLDKKTLSQTFPEQYIDQILFQFNVIRDPSKEKRFN